MLFGFDIGGTKILGVATDEEGRVRAEVRVPTPPTADALVAGIQHAAAQLGGTARAVGVGIAGLVGRDGRVRLSPHIEQAEALDLPGHLGRAFGVPVIVENDATVATWGEARAGAGRGVDDLVLITLGTGVGSGVVCNGALVRGAHGFAGEAGHMIVDRDGVRHVTGLPGAWEHYASGTALGALIRAAGLGESGEDLARGLAARDPSAAVVLDAFAREVAVGVANLVAVLDPELIIVGGGVSELGEPLRAAIAAHLPRLLIGAEHRLRLRVVLATLGEQAGAIGAALLAASSCRSDPAN